MEKELDYYEDKKSKQPWFIKRLAELRKKHPKESNETFRYFDMNDLYNVFDYEKLDKGIAIYIPYGGRKSGKSYETQRGVIYEAITGNSYKWFKKGKKVPIIDGRTRFLLLRRKEAGVKNDGAVEWFNHEGDPMLKFIYTLTDGEYDRIIQYNKRLFLARYNEETGKMVKGPIIGYYDWLDQPMDNLKSRQKEKLRTVVFEEFMTAGAYLEDETAKFMTLIHTLARPKLQVIMIANTESLVCPYFDDWSLEGLRTQKLRLIKVYKHYITPDKNGNPRYINIITQRLPGQADLVSLDDHKREYTENGEFDTREFPLLKDEGGEGPNLRNYTQLYVAYIEKDSHAFKAYLLQNSKGMAFVYVKYEHDYFNEIQRRITDDFETSPYHSTHFIPKTRFDKVMLQLIKEGKICYNTNQTGTSFMQLVEQKRIF